LVDDKNADLKTYTEVFMREMDHSKDGKITYQEFLEFATNVASS